MTKRPSMHSDKHWVKSKWYPLIVGATAAFVVVFGFIFIDSTEDAAFKARERIDITEHVGHVSDAVKSVFSIHLGALNALEGLVKTRPNLTQDVFKGVAMALVQGHPAIRQIQLSPDAIVTYLHPTHAKDKARGLDLRSLPTQRVAVEQTIRDGLIKTVGPLTLAQGGRALITRKPIYTGNGQNRRFWGFATIILDYPRLLKELRASLDHHLFDVVLKVSDANGRKGEFIFGDRDRFSPNQDVMAKIDLPGTRWVLAVAPRNGWASHRPGRWLLLVVGFLVSVLCGALAYWDAARRIALKSAEQEAIEKSALHQTTLGSMAQGIAVYDADLRLISFNDRFGKILRLPPELLHEGVSLEKIIRYRNERGDYDERDVKESVEKRIERAKFTDERTEERTLPDGMVYVYHRKPMPGGGGVTTFTDITERKRMERALQVSEERFRRAFEGASVGMAMRNIHDRTLIANEAFQKMVGYSRDELERMRIDSITHPEDRAANQDLHQELRDGKTESIQNIKRYIHKNGELVWIVNDMSLIRDAQGQPLFTMNLYQNITERKQAEKALQESEERLSAVVNYSPAKIHIKDAEGRYVLINPIAEKLFAVTDKEARGKTTHEIFAPDIAAKFVSHDQAVLETGQVVEDEEEWSTEDGLRTFLTVKFPITDASGQISAIGAIGTDITERKQAEHGLRQSEERFRTLVEHAPEAITMIDVDTGLYVDANPMAEALHGLPRDALIENLGPVDLSPEIQPDGRPSSEAAADYLSRALAGEFPRFEWMHLTPDGQETICEVSLARLPDPHRKLVRASISDITERKAAEAQLRQSQKMEAVGQLTGGIAHDFNNLLAVSMGNAELAQEAAQSGGDVQPFLATIKRASERGASLTGQLLAFSRKQTLFPQVIDAGELVGETVDLLRSSLGETIEIKVIAHDDLWPCEVDPHQLESAILNLAINARDAMPSGGSLTIGASNVSLDDDYAAAQTEVEPGEYVMVAMSDTGAGMPKEVIDQVFDPFFTTKEVGRGSGLGLSMVYGFVKQSGGYVTVYSEEGEGTTIKLYLPRSDKAKEHSGQTDQENVPQAHGETILVVEDDPDVRTLAVAILSGLGYEILEASDGKTALKMLESAPRVNLLFTDVVMPGGMSGLELAAEVHSRFPGIVVLYTSGYTDLANVDQSTFDEDTELLQKPYGRANLARKVRQVLDQARS